MRARKNQKTRWASYTPKHNINFNIKLAAIPEHLIEYTVIHELAHTKETKHNKKFWYLVERYCPSYRESKKELTKYELLIQKNIAWQKMLKR